MRVFVVSEVQLYQAAIMSALATRHDVEVVGLASSLRETRAGLRHVATDVVLVDLSPTEQHLRALGPMAYGMEDVRFIAVKRGASDDEVRAWREAGASAVLERGASIAELHAMLLGVPTSSK